MDYLISIKFSFLVKSELSWPSRTIDIKSDIALIFLVFAVVANGAVSSEQAYNAISEASVS